MDKLTDFLTGGEEKLAVSPAVAEAIVTGLLGGTLGGALGWKHYHASEDAPNSLSPAEREALLGLLHEQNRQRVEGDEDPRTLAKKQKLVDREAWLTQHSLIPTAIGGTTGALAGAGIGVGAARILGAPPMGESMNGIRTSLAYLKGVIGDAAKTGSADAVARRTVRLINMMRRIKRILKGDDPDAR